DRDGTTTARVAMVSQEAAKRFWAGRSPLGTSVTLANSRTPLTVVGVVADFRLNWYDPAPRPVVYLADPQSPARSASIVIRTRVEPLLLARQVRAVVARMDDRQPISELEPLTSTIEDSLSPVRVIKRLLTIGASLAAFLAAIGIY